MPRLHRQESARLFDREPLDATACTVRSTEHTPPSSLHHDQPQAATSSSLSQVASDMTLVEDAPQVPTASHLERPD